MARRRQVKRTLEGIARMKKFVIDTDIFSFAFKGDSRVEPFKDLLDSAEICLSFMTVAELYHWSIARKWGENRLRALKLKIAQCAILGYDEATAWHWAQITNV